MKGGDKRMCGTWTKNNLVPPTKLLNKDIDATSTVNSDDSSELQNSATAGGVKLTALAGALFNHKDDKKGHQDSHRNFLRICTGGPYTFPDTSNTRFQSHCAAAANLLLHRSHHIEFLDQVRDRKGALNHMEQNVYKGLHDVPTLAELVVLMLYAEVISHDYL